MIPNVLPPAAPRVVLALGLALGAGAGACAHVKPLPPGEALSEAERLEAIGRARVWSAVDVAKVDLRSGPAAEGAFAPNAWVNCVYKEQKEQSGRSPKFVCETSPGHPLKVKYGPRNAEVFGEVLAIAENNVCHIPNRQAVNQH